MLSGNASMSWSVRLYVDTHKTTFTSMSPTGSMFTDAATAWKSDLRGIGSKIGMEARMTRTDTPVRITSTSTPTTHTK